MPNIVMTAICVGCLILVIVGMVGAYYAGMGRGARLAWEEIEEQRQDYQNRAELRDEEYREAQG